MIGMAVLPPQGWEHQPDNEKAEGSHAATHDLHYELTVRIVCDGPVKFLTNRLGTVARRDRLTVHVAIAGKASTRGVMLRRQGKAAANQLDTNAGRSEFTICAFCRASDRLGHSMLNSAGAQA